MCFTRCIRVLCLATIATQASYAFAGTAGSISGNVTDAQGIAVPDASVKILTLAGAQVKETSTNATGDYSVFPIDFGDYTVSIKVTGYEPYELTIHVASEGTTQADAQLSAPGKEKEMVLKVQAKKKLVQNSTSVSSTEISSEKIATLPQGDSITLPKLITTTTPGVVQGTFGQMFFRGNHANIQYQIDGVQLPDSPSNTFGEAFSPRNIDHMEIITGGIPAEYGERLAAVVNIITKTGAETPGGALDLNYGSYDTFQPFALISGSSASGEVHYFLSAQYKSTSRGLDTPQPSGTGGNSDVTQGGTDAVHDNSNGNNQFAKIDWLADNDNKLSFILFNAYSFFQIPNYPTAFPITDPIFNGPDTFGNGNPGYNFTPPGTDDNQIEDNAYFQAVWKHTFTQHSFLQLAPYYKYSFINFNNDPANDLFEANGPSAIPGANASSFNENRHVNNLGLKGDFTDRINDLNLLKAGFQVQASQAAGYVSVIAQATGSAAIPSLDNGTVNSYFESAYIQDDFTISKSLVLNAGVRYDVTQFYFPGSVSQDGLAQPRIGLNYMLTDTTKLHVFYGKLFQPAPAENLRDTFVETAGGVSGTGCPANSLCQFDIKAEKDDYEEVGVSQQVGNQLLTLNAYYKDAANMLDDTQLLNTSISQPFNFNHGYAYGVEFSAGGKMSDDWSEYINYSYETAKGQGISGGIFAFPPNTDPNGGYQFLDHVQVSTANAGVTYAKDRYYWTTQALFGSGLRTGDSNSLSLPSHFSMDTTVGYNFAGDSWFSKFKLSADVLNIFNNIYPVTIANGFNGSHYVAGREFFVRLTKEL